ncbi:hypothetical protein WN943_008090 [Citrus x changshan-huyou]
MVAIVAVKDLPSGHKGILFSRQRNGSGFVGLRPINLCIALGFASPVPAPYVLRLIPRHSKDWACVVDEAGNEGFNKYRVSDITKSAETLVLAEFYGKGWSSMNSGCFNFKENRMKMTALLHPAQSAGNFMTAVEFSVENPCGRAVILLNLKSGSVKNEVAGEDAAAGRFLWLQGAYNLETVNRSIGIRAIPRVKTNQRKRDAIAVVAAPPEKSLA